MHIVLTVPKWYRRCTINTVPYAISTGTVPYLYSQYHILRLTEQKRYHLCTGLKPLQVPSWHANAVTVLGKSCNWFHLITEIVQTYLPEETSKFEIDANIKYLQDISLRKYLAMVTCLVTELMVWITICFIFGPQSLVGLLLDVIENQWSQSACSIIQTWI